ncbi:unnamed protein product [Trichobilharzia regenti]|nr:unnamed protein product [Trichobilharzia regenti]
MEIDMKNRTPTNSVFIVNETLLPTSSNAGNEEDFSNVNIKSDEMMTVVNYEDIHSIGSDNGSCWSDDSSPESNILPASYHFKEDDPLVNPQSRDNNDDDNDGDGEKNQQTILSSSIKRLKKLRLNAKYRKQNLALLFCINLAKHLSHEWPKIVDQFKQSIGSLATISPGSSQHFVPVLQLIISLIRILHSNACQLNAEIISLQQHILLQSTISTDHAEISYQDKFYLEYIKQLLQTIKISVKQLIRALIHGVLQTASIEGYSEDNKPTDEDSVTIKPLNTVHLRENLEIIINLDCSLSLGFIVLQLNALTEIFASIPSSSMSSSSSTTSNLNSPTSLSLINLWLYDGNYENNNNDNVGVDNCKTLNQHQPLSPSVVPIVQQETSSKLLTTATTTTSTTTTTTKTTISQSSTISTDENELRALFDQTIEFCLILMETLYTRLLKVHEETARDEQGDTKRPMNSSIVNYPNAISNPLACGVLQGSMFSSQYSGDTLIGTSVSGLLSHSPLLNTSQCLDHIGNPIMSQLVWLATKACVKLPNILLYFASSLMKDKSVSLPSTSGKSTFPPHKLSYLSSESEVRWCSVLFNYKELLNHPNLYQSQFTAKTQSSHQGNNNPDSVNTVNSSNHLFQFINLEGFQHTSKIINPLGRELQSVSYMD